LQALAPKESLNQIFAQTWEGVRAGKNLKPQGGPIDILRAKGLLQVGAMLEPARLKAALKTAGWTAPAIMAVLAGIQSDAGAGPAAPEAQTPTSPDAPADPLTLDLLRRYSGIRLPGR
jgi:hypothetical protein